MVVEFFLMILWIIVMAVYDSYLKKECGYSAFMFWRIVVACFCSFCWLGVIAADTVTFEIVLALIIAILLALFLLALNYQTSGNKMHAISMTLFQLTWGFIIVGIFVSSARGDGKGKKKER